jgi:hypothetical protein
MLWASDGAVPTPDRGELILAAAGERIVAFARPGKSPEIPFLGPIECLPGSAKRRNSSNAATVFKSRRGIGTGLKEK